MKYICKICGYVYNENKQKVKFEDLPANWKCEDCGVPKSYFQVESRKKQAKPKFAKSETSFEDTVYVQVNEGCKSIERNSKLCVSCGACKNVCKNQQAVCGYIASNKIEDKNICIDCGQCTLACPTGAINFKNDIDKVKKALADPTKVVVFQTAPAVRVALGEEFGFRSGTECEKKVVSALRKLGGKYVFDTTFGADLTIMEEASELIERINNNGIMPMFTSCCPAWVKFAEIFYPEILPNLSTCKSPILMQGAIIKTYFAKKMNIDPNCIINVAITPCTAKKMEIAREEMNACAEFNKNKTLRDVDYVLTVRELAKWLKEKRVNFDKLKDSEYDNPLGKASGGGVIFGNSGGVMESALRTASYMLTGKSISKVEFASVRNEGGIKKANVKLGDKVLKVAVVSGTANVRKLLASIKKGLHYDFVEVMACPNGCISGGGQPKTTQAMKNEAYQNRTNGLYGLDITAKVRCSYENEDIKTLYADFLGKPLSDLSEKLLHTSYINKK